MRIYNLRQNKHERDISENALFFDSASKHDKIFRSKFLTHKQYKY